MKKISHYEVWTQYKGETGVLIFSGAKYQCNGYIRQACKKGAQPNHFAMVVRFKEKGRS